MLTLASADNGGAHTRAELARAGNTVGSLTEAQEALIIGCLLGDGAMRCKTHGAARDQPFGWSAGVRGMEVPAVAESRRDTSKS